MASPSYLIKRNGIYYARVPVPLLLQSELGRKEVWKSLGNRSYKEACCLLRNLILSNAVFMASSVFKTTALTNQLAMKKIGERQFYLERQRCAKEYLSYQQTFNSENFEAEVRETNLMCRHSAMEERISELQADLERANFKPYETILSMRLHSTRYHPPSRDTSFYKTAMTEIIMGSLRGVKAAKEGIESGDYVDYIADQFEPYPDWMLPPLPPESLKHNESIVRKSIPESSGITFGELVDKFNNAPDILQRSEGVRVKDKTHQYLLLDIVGRETRISNITRQLVRDKVLSALEILPAGFRQKKIYKGLLPSEIVILEKKNPSEFPKLRAPSRNDYIEHLSALFEWAKMEGFEVPNPTEKLYFKDSVRAVDKRHPLSPEAYTKLFSDVSILSAKNTLAEAHQFWIAAISFCTGMRQTEILMLALDDIKQQNDIWHFYISERGEDGRTLKTDNSIRTVPISEALKSLGFLEFYHRVKKDPRNNNRLFPYVTRGAKKPSAPFSNWFRRQLIRLEVKTAKTNFHSLRHNFRDFIRESKLTPEEKEIALAFSAWETGEKVHNAYGLGFSLLRMKEVIDKIHIPVLEVPSDSLRGVK